MKVYQSESNRESDWSGIFVNMAMQKRDAFYKSRGRKKISAANVFYDHQIQKIHH